MVPNAGMLAMTTAGSVLPTKVDFRRYAMLGYISIALVFGGFGIRASLAPLDRAAVASGQVAVDSDHKAVQHLEGGIVVEILAKETQQAKTDIFRKQFDAALAEDARLVAEQTDAASIAFPASVLARRNVSETATAIADQQRQFVERRNSLASQINILNSQIAQQQQELAKVFRKASRTRWTPRLTSKPFSSVFQT